MIAAYRLQLPLWLGSVEDAYSMPTTTYTLEQLFQGFKDEIGFDEDKVTFIRRLNRQLLDLNITKPAEQLEPIYFSDEFRKYLLPAGFRSPIGLRDNNRFGAVGLLHRLSPGRISQLFCGNGYATQNNGVAQYLEVLHSVNKSNLTQVTACDSLTADGAWTAGAGVANIAVDTITKHQGTGSITFDVTAATATITFIRTNTITIADYTEHCHEGFYLWLATKPTQISVRFGNDASNYYAKTITTQANGEEFSTSLKNEIRIDKNGATETGTVDDAAIDYFAFVLSFSTNPNNSGYKIDDIVLFKPEILTLEYYTKYVAQDAAGAVTAKISESETAAEIPLIFDDYIQTLIDGMSYRYFLKTKPELAEHYRRNYLGTYMPNGALMSGRRFLEMRYPDREQHTRQEILLPSL